MTDARIIDEIKNNPHFIASVMRLWEAGFDTDRIARVLDEKQQVIERALHLGMESKRRNETQSK